MRLLASTSVWLLLTLILGGCQSPEKPVNDASGQLYIIGGGKRPLSMIDELVQIANLHDAGHYGIVLPMASSEPDTSFYYLKKQFDALGNFSLTMFNIGDAHAVSSALLDSIENASMVYITGGDQNKFMEIVLNSPVHQAILAAYQKGALIAGTSAGAAVQSRKMITGNEHKYPEYTGIYRTIEAENIEIAEGLGLLETAIVDQHFIWRMRMNRLIAAAIENPGELLIGIDESTAIVVQGDSARVSGLSQVVVVHNKRDVLFEQNGLLGSQGMELSVYLPGQRFSILP